MAGTLIQPAWSLREANARAQPIYPVTALDWPDNTLWEFVGAAGATQLGGATVSADIPLAGISISPESDVEAVRVRYNRLRAADFNSDQASLIRITRDRPFFGPLYAPVQVVPEFPAVNEGSVNDDYTAYGTIVYGDEYTPFIPAVQDWGRTLNPDPFDTTFQRFIRPQLTVDLHLSPIKLPFSPGRGVRTYKANYAATEGSTSEEIALVLYVRGARRVRLVAQNVTVGANFNVRIDGFTPVDAGIFGAFPSIRNTMAINELLATTTLTGSPTNTVLDVVIEPVAVQWLVVFATPSVAQGPPGGTGNIPFGITIED